MTLPFLIGLTGPANCGKDTVGRMLGHPTRAFAGPLKMALAAMGFPEPDREMKELPIPGFNFTWRRAAQTLGTEWGRTLQSDLWLAIAQREHARLGSMANPPTFLTLTDVRFHNEADWVRQFGLLVHIRGRQAFDMTPDARQHESEQQLPAHDVDFILHNDRSLGHLKAEVQRLEARMVEQCAWWKLSRG